MKHRETLYALMKALMKHRYNIHCNIEKPITDETPEDAISINEKREKALSPNETPENDISPYETPENYICPNETPFMYTEKLNKR